MHLWWSSPWKALFCRLCHSSHWLLLLRSYNAIPVLANAPHGHYPHFYYFFCLLLMSSALIRMTRYTHLCSGEQKLNKEKQALILIPAAAAEATPKANAPLQCSQMPGVIQIEADSTILILLPCSSVSQ